MSRWRAGRGRPGRGTVWVLSELYHPEVTSTGHYMTAIAERLAADGHTVAVLCGQPTYGARGVRAPRHEFRHGVLIRRCGGTTFDKDLLLGRIANTVTLSASTFWHGLRRIGPGDVVIAVSNPPTMPLVGMLVTALRRARFVALFHDVLPVVLEVAGGRSPNAPSVRMARWITARVVHRSDPVVAVGRPQVAELRRLGAGPVVVIPTWADDGDVIPVAPDASSIRRELDLVGARVALYAGTFGRANDLDTLLAAASILEARTDIVLVLCGDGPQRPAVERRIARHGLHNVVVTGPFPRSEQSDMYGAGDVVVIPMIAGMGRSSMPSRAYNSLASGRPIVAASEADSELALLVGEHHVGRVVPPGDAPALAAAIEAALDDPDRAALATRARAVASGPASVATALAAWSALVATLAPRSS